jgi:hypothetical protein
MKMKKLIFSVLANFAIAHVSSATTVITTQEYTVPGKATGVTVTGSSVTTNCDPCSSCVCYHGVLTIKVEQSRVVNTHISIDVTNEKGMRYIITGNVVESTHGVLSNGAIQYSYQLTEMSIN